MACLVLFADTTLSAPSIRSVLQPFPATDFLLRNATLILLIASAVCDGAILSIATNSDYLRPSEKRDLLILTGITSSQIVGAITTIARTRAWRICAVEIGLRVAIFTLYAGRLMPDWLEESATPGTFPTALTGIALLVVYGWLLILEPYLRMHRVVAVGLLGAADTSMTRVLIRLFSVWVGSRVYQVLTGVGLFMVMLITFYAFALIGTGFMSRRATQFDIYILSISLIISGVFGAVCLSLIGFAARLSNNNTDDLLRRVIVAMTPMNELERMPDGEVHTFKYTDRATHA